MASKHPINVMVNGVSYQREVDARLSLVDFLRNELHLKATHVGCEHGVCGACTILINGESMRSCLVLAVQADGAELTTVEGLSDGANLHPVQQAFVEKHGLQCGFCTPGFLMSSVELLERNADPSDDEIKEVLGGHLCRCTGYQSILESVKLAAEMTRMGKIKEIAS